MNTTKTIDQYEVVVSAPITTRGSAPNYGLHYQWDIQVRVHRKTLGYVRFQTEAMPWCCGSFIMYGWEMYTGGCYSESKEVEKIREQQGEVAAILRAEAEELILSTDFMPTRGCGYFIDPKCNIDNTIKFGYYAKDSELWHPSEKQVYNCNSGNMLTTWILDRSRFLKQF